MPIDRTLAAIDATLTALEDPMPDTDRIPLRTVPTREDRMTAATDPARDIEAERDDLRIALHRAEAETRTQDRAVRELTAELAAARAELDTNDTAWRTELAQVRAERDQARTAVTAVERERDEAYAEITDVWAAINAAGTQGPGSPADHIRQLAGQRDTALHLVDVRTAALARRTEQLDNVTSDLDHAREVTDRPRGDLTAAHRVVAAVRTGTLEDIDRAMAAYDAPTDLAGPTNARRQDAAERPSGPGEGTNKGDGENGAHRGAEGDDDSARLADALEHAESGRIDVDGDLWRPAPGGQWTLSGARHVTIDEEVLEHMHGPTRPVLIVDIWRDEQDDEQDQADDAPPLGSGPDRTQGQQAGYEVVVTRLHHGPRGALQSGDVIVSAVVDAVDAATATDALAQVQRALGAPEPIRAAGWERKAIDAVATGLANAWNHLAQDPVHTEQLATVAVRAIVTTGLAGAGGRCPTCGATYPCTVPDGEDPRCWTCSSEPDPAALDEHRDTVGQVLDNVRNGRPASAPTEG